MIVNKQGLGNFNPGNSNKVQEAKNLIKKNLHFLVNGKIEKILKVLGIDHVYFEKIKETIIEPTYEKIIKVFQEYIAKVLGANSEVEQIFYGLLEKKANYHEIVRDLITCLVIATQAEGDLKEIKKYAVRVFNILSIFDVSILARTDIFVDLFFLPDQVFDIYIKKYKNKLYQYEGLHCILSYRKMIRDAFDEVIGIIRNGGGEKTFEEIFDSLLLLADQKLLQHVENGFVELYKIFLYWAEGFEYDKNIYNSLVQKGRFLLEDYGILCKSSGIIDDSFDMITGVIKERVQPLERKNKKSDKILSNHEELLSLFFEIITGKNYISYEEVCRKIDNMKPDVWKFGEENLNPSLGFGNDYVNFRNKDLRKQTETFCNLIYDFSNGELQLDRVFLGNKPEDVLYSYTKHVYSKGLSNLSFEEWYQQIQKQYESIKNIFGKIVESSIFKEKVQAKGEVLGILLPFLSDEFFIGDEERLDINDLFLLVEIYEYCFAAGNISKYSGTTQRILKGFFDYVALNDLDSEIVKSKLGFFVDARMQFNKYGAVNTQGALEIFWNIYQKTNICTDKDFILSGIDLRKEKNFWLPKSGAADEEIYAYIESWYRYIVKGVGDIPDTHKKMIHKVLEKLNISKETLVTRAYPRQLLTTVKFFAYLAGMDPTNGGTSLLKNMLDFAKQGRMELRNLFFMNFSDEVFTQALQRKKIVLGDYKNQEDSIFGIFSYIQIGPEKKLARLLEKYFEGSATDLIRFKVGYDDQQSLEDGVISFLKHCYNNPDIIQVSMIDNMGNVFERAYKGSGYQDIKFLIKTTSGHIIEAQFSSTQIFEAKDGLGIALGVLSKEAVSTRYAMKVALEDLKLFATIKDTISKVVSGENVGKFGLLLQAIHERKEIGENVGYLNGQDFYEINRALQKLPHPTESLENICTKLERIVFEMARKNYLLGTIEKWMKKEGT